MTGRTTARIFVDHVSALDAVGELEAADFGRKEIEMVTLDGIPAAPAPREGPEAAGDSSSSVATGASLGTGLGGGAGLLAGLGAVAVPGVGPVVAAGWLVAALTGAGVGAAAGGVLGALTRTGGGAEDPEDQPKPARKGGTLVTVRAENEERVAEAEAIMDRYWTAVEPYPGLETQPHA